jgi:hypothetical protein
VRKGLTRSSVILAMLRFSRGRSRILGRILLRTLPPTTGTSRLSLFRRNAAVQVLQKKDRARVLVMGPPVHLPLMPALYRSNPPPQQGLHHLKVHCQRVNLPKVMLLGCLKQIIYAGIGMRCLPWALVCLFSRLATLRYSSFLQKKCCQKTNISFRHAHIYIIKSTK